MNKVTHFEIPFDDKERAMKFYQEVFNWQMQDMPEMSYVIAQGVAVDDNHMPKESGAINGGMYKRDGSLSQHPVLVIDTQDLDSHLEKIKSAGGSITREKVKVGDMGYYAQVMDTEENVIGVWEAIKK